MSANGPATDASPGADARVLLSYNELLVILRLLGAGGLPGVGADPLGELSADQQAYGLLVAERALRARELARGDEGGGLLVQRGVLELVGSCVLAQGTLIATHVHTGDGRAAQWFGHRLDATFVAHLLPDPVLHQFTQVGDRGGLVKLFGDLAGWPDCPAAPAAPLVLPGEIIAAVRERAPQNREAAAALLAAANAEGASATALLDVLAQPYGVTVVQAIHRRDADAAAVASVTVLSHTGGLWLMTEVAGGQGGNYRLAPATRAEAATLISQLEW